MLSLLLYAVAAQGQPVPVTLDRLREDPAAYAGKIVRVSGQVDQCWNMSCNLCPISATPGDPQWDRCLAVDFHRFRGGTGNVGADMDSAFRYADVIATARFDPSCLEGLCLDKASVLLDARVLDVTRRRRSREGLIRRPDSLSDAPADAARPLLALVRPQDEYSSQMPVRVFATSSDPQLRRGAVVCQSLAIGDRAPEWPTNWQGALSARSTEDRYRCWTARRDQEQWVLEPR